MGRTFFIALLLLSVTACMREGYWVEDPYERIGRVAEIFMTPGGDIYLDFDASDEWDNESRRFYAACDSSLTVRYWHSRIHPEYDPRVAIDWRLTKVEVTALEDYDRQHPAGSSLNDILMFFYYYKGERVGLPLSKLKYGDMMLSEYNPYWHEIQIGEVGREVLSGAIEVTIEDAFGRVMTVRNDTQIPPYHLREIYEDQLFR